MIYDVIIVGAGPAGLTAAIYAGRRTMKALVLGKDLGGQIAKATEVENYPGFDSISGIELMQKCMAQAQKFGAEVIFEDVKAVKKEGKNFVVQTHSSKYKGNALILAYGKTPRSLDVKGEDKFANKGISYCANCDMPVFKNKIIAVVGGGNSALDAALYGSKIAKQVYLIHRREEFRADEITVAKARKTKNIKFVLNAITKEIKGNKFVSSLIVENVKTKEIEEIALDGIFVEIGFEVKTDIVAHLVKLDEYKQIIVDNRCATTHPGIFACGDITNTPIKQAVVAAGEGAKAALSAYNWLQGKAPAVIVDWTKK